MAGSEYRFSYRGGDPRPVDAAWSSDQQVNSGLMESVIRQTLSAANPLEPLEPADREALLDVVKQYRGRPFVVDPVAKALVRAVLQRAIPATWTGSEVWRRMTAQIAETFCEDPAMRMRMEELWARLCGGEL